MKDAEVTGSENVWERSNWIGDLPEDCNFLYLGYVLCFMGATLVRRGIARFNGDGNSFTFLLVLGGLLAAAGAILLTTRKGITVNRQERTVNLWTKWLYFSSHKLLPLAEFASVSLRLLETKSRRRGPAYTAYSVWLLGIADDALAVVDSGYESARQDAEELGRFLSLPVLDYICDEEEVQTSDEYMPVSELRTGDEVPHAPEDVDRSVRKQRRNFRRPLPKDRIAFVIAASAVYALIAFGGKKGDAPRWWEMVLTLVFVASVFTVIFELSPVRNCPRCGASMGRPQNFNIGKYKRATKNGKRLPEITLGQNKGHRNLMPYYFCENCDAEFRPEELTPD